MKQQAPMTILVTGGSGHVASHLILLLLAAGHRVRTTVRSHDKITTAKQFLLQNEKPTERDNLAFFVADLTRDEGWAQAMEGCDYVQHVASPFPARAPKTEDEVISPAREGTLRVLKAAKAAGVKRVIMTSSFAAIGYGHKNKDVFDERDWSNEEGLPAYHKSKLLAERAAWDFIASQEPKQDAESMEIAPLELTVINPVGIFGPVITRDISSSVALIKSLLDGSLPGCPRLFFNLVDVRDLARLHVTVMTHPQASGQRFIASNDGDPLALIDLAHIIRTSKPDQASKVPNYQLPDWIVRITALGSSKARGLLPQLGQRRIINTKKARDMVGWKTRAVEETICDTVDSLARHSLL